MNKRLVSIISIFSLCVTMTGCLNKNNDSSSNSTENSQITTTSPKSESIGEIDTYIKLSDNNTTVDGEGVTVENNTITITNAGTYSVSGSLSDGQVIINTNKEEKTYILLDGAKITCSNSAAINVISSKKTVISLADGTKNYIKDGSEYVFEDETTDEPNAAIFSKEDLTFIGTGSLEVSGNYDRAIVSKDDLVIQDGNINVTSVGDALRGKDSVVVTGGKITINAGGDGIKSNNTEDTSKGYVSIEGGKLDITAGQDGIQGETNTLIKAGDIKISSGGGSANSSSDKNNQEWGNWGGRPDQISKGPNEQTTTTENTDTSEESTSAKGIKAGVNITIDGGTIDIDSSDDSIHSNYSLLINSGTINMSSGDDGIHSDSTLEINGGDINLTKSYEGIESEVITINDGKIHVVTSDDGMNAAGGNDGSSMNGRPGQNNFASESNGAININGGYIVVDADGDGIGSNGNIEMTDGVVIVNGPTNGGNGALDYDGNFNISGGTLITAGGLGMVQTPSDSSSQNSLNISVSQQDANSIIHVEDESGNNVLTFAPSKTYQSVVVSSPEIKSNSTYKVYVGGSSTGTQSDGLYSGGTYSNGTEVGSTTVSSSITSITQDGISSGGSIGMPRGGRGGNKGNMQSAPQSNVRNENTQQGNIEGEIQ